LARAPQIFVPLRGHARFYDLVANLERIIEHFGKDVHTPIASANLDSGEKQEGEAAWSVDKVLAHIRTAARGWHGEPLPQLMNLRFTYEQEASPEEFFTPYLWMLLYEHAGISWQGTRIVLFPLGSTAPETPTDDDLPMLATIDVDESGMSQGSQQ
jgi:hypothetical protein